MNPGSMDDKLYYVESTHGQILGPLSMILILEGIAAGKVSEAARICEVGQREWISLGEIAYTRGDAGALPEVENPSGPEIAVDLSVPSAAEISYGDIELEPDPTGVEASGIFDAPSLPPRPFEASPEVESREGLDSPDLEIVFDSGATAEPEASSFFSSPRRSERGPGEAPEEPSFTRERDPWRHEEPIPAESTAPASASAEGLVARPPSGHRPSTSEELAPSTSELAPEEDPSFARAAWNPAEGSHGLASEAPFGTEEAVPVADEFALAMEVQVRDEALEDDDSESPSSKRRWVVPALVGVAIPTIAGVYLLTGGHVEIPGLSPAPVPAPVPSTTSPGTTLQEAWALLSAGNPQAALDEFRRLAAADPTSAEAQHGIGRAAFMTRNLSLAKKHFTEAVRLDPTSLLYGLDLCQAELELGETDQAERSARAVLALDPDEPRAHLFLGQARLALGDAEEAVRELSIFLESSPRNGGVRADLALALAQSGRLEPAIEALGQYLEESPEDADAQSKRFEWMASLGQRPQAATLYAGLAAKHPDDSHLQYLAGLAHGDSEKGIAFLRLAVALNPRHRDALLALAKAHQAQGDRNAALESLDKALALSPGSEEELALRTQVESMEERPIEPVAPARPEISPVELALTVQEIQQALDRGSFNSARNLVKSAQATFSKDSRAAGTLKFCSGIIDFEEGKFANALACFESLDPGARYRPPKWRGVDVRTWDVRIWLAWTHLALGDARRAVQALDGVSPENPNDYSTARLWEGVALAELGMADVAMRTWDSVSSDIEGKLGDPGRAALLSAKFLAGEVSEKDFRVAVEPLAGFENDMHYFLGRAASLEKRADLARDHYLNSIDSSRGHEFPYHLAHALVAQTE
jgi:tetratricopeptide (TPR) repeat protein